MAADINDKFTETTNGGRPIPTELQVQKAIGAVQITVGSTGGWAVATSVHFIMYKKDASGKKIDGTQTDWKGIVLDASTIGNLVLKAGADDIYPIGSVITAAPTAAWADDVVEGLAVSLNQDGTMKTNAVKDALGITGDTPPDWTLLPTIPTVTANNGQKEHVLTYPGIDLTPTLQAGTKLRIPRTGTTPTTSMSFNGTTQYASKTSPTGITFTDDFTCEAWVYLNEYGTGSTIISRFNGTSGWYFDIMNSGQVRLLGFNSGAGNQSNTTSFQSIPLNKWTHIAVALDMSTFTAAASPIYMDGVSVPTTVSRFGTNPTSLVQAGDLRIGMRDGTISPFSGKIANARIWSTIRTAAQIRDNMNQENPASTTGLVAHFKGNGSWNDSSANANNLTPAAGALNNFASNPYSAVEYAIVTKVEKPATDTLVTVFSGSGSIPQEVLGATSYSTARTPFGFPADKNKWQAISIYNVILSNDSPSQNVWYYVNGGLMLPIGGWTLGFNAHAYGYKSSGTGVSASATLSSTSAMEDDKGLTSGIYASSTGATEIGGAVVKSKAVNITTPTFKYLNLKADSPAQTWLRLDSNRGSTVITAECAYL